MILFWVQNKLQDYPISVTNFSTCWNDGLAFCALIHVFYPEAFDWSSLKPENRRYNFTLAFQAAEELADIYPLLEVDDMVRFQKPDWKCVFTYVQSFYRRFRDGRSPPRRSPSPSTQAKQAAASPTAVMLAVAEQAKEDENKFSKKKLSHPPMKLNGQSMLETSKNGSTSVSSPSSAVSFSSSAVSSKSSAVSSPTSAVSSPTAEYINKLEASKNSRTAGNSSHALKTEMVNTTDKGSLREQTKNRFPSSERSEAKIELSPVSNALRKSSFVKSYSCDAGDTPKSPTLAATVSKSPNYSRSSSLDPSYQQAKPKFPSPPSDKENSPVWVKNSDDSRPISPSRIKANERAKSPTMFKAASKERSDTPGLRNATALDGSRRSVSPGLKSSTPLDGSPHSVRSEKSLLPGGLKNSTSLDGSTKIINAHLKTAKSCSPPVESPRVLLTPPPEDLKPAITQS